MALVKRFQVKESLEQMDQTSEAILVEDQAVAELRLQLSMAKWGLEMEEARIKLEAKGSNADERKYGAVLAMGNDDKYGASLATVNGFERDIAQREGSASRLRRQHQAQSLRIEGLIATVNYLGGKP